MDWGLVGAGTGSASLIGIIICYIVKIAGMETKVNLLWTLYVEDRLKKLVEEGTMGHSSEYSITEKGEGLLAEELKLRLREIAIRKKPKSLFNAQTILAREFKNPELFGMSNSAGYTIGEMVLLASAYMLKVKGE